MYGSRSTASRVEEVGLRILDVDEDRVVLRRPAALGARAVVVGPDDLVEEALAAEDLVEEHLGVVRLARVEMQVERAVLPRGGGGPPRAAGRGSPGSRRRCRRTPWSRGRSSGSSGPANPVRSPLWVGLGREAEAALLPAGVERRVEVDQLERRRPAAAAAGPGCRRGGSPPRASRATAAGRRPVRSRTRTVVKYQKARGRPERDQEREERAAGDGSAQPGSPWSRTTSTFTAKTP